MGNKHASGTARPSRPAAVARSLWDTAADDLAALIRFPGNRRDFAAALAAIKSTLRAKGLTGDRDLVAALAALMAETAGFTPVSAGDRADAAPDGEQPDGIRAFTQAAAVLVDESTLGLVKQRRFEDAFAQQQAAIARVSEQALARPTVADTTIAQHDSHATSGTAHAPERVPTPRDERRGIAPSLSPAATAPDLPAALEPVAGALRQIVTAAADAAGALGRLAETTDGTGAASPATAVPTDETTPEHRAAAWAAPGRATLGEIAAVVRQGQAGGLTASQALAPILGYLPEGPRKAQLAALGQVTDQLQATRQAANPLQGALSGAAAGVSAVELAGKMLGTAVGPVGLMAGMALGGVLGGVSAQERAEQQARRVREAQLAELRKLNNALRPVTDYFDHGAFGALTSTRAYGAAPVEYAWAVEQRRGRY